MQPELPSNQNFDLWSAVNFCFQCPHKEEDWIPCYRTTRCIHVRHVYSIVQAASRCSTCCGISTDHVFAVCGGARSAFLCAAQSCLHLFHLVFQHLLLLGQLLVTVDEDTAMDSQKNHWALRHSVSVQHICVCVCVHLTSWSGCGAPRSPPTAWDCCRPCSRPPASASSPPPGAFGCSSGGRQHSTPALMFHCGGKHTNTCSKDLCGCSYYSKGRREENPHITYNSALEASPPKASKLPEVILSSNDLLATIHRHKLYFQSLFVL